MLINTNDVPDTTPTINSEPVNILCEGVELVVGGPPSDDAGCPVGGASIFSCVCAFFFFQISFHPWNYMLFRQFSNCTIVALISSFNVIHEY